MSCSTCCSRATGALAPAPPRPLQRCAARQVARRCMAHATHGLNACSSSHQLPAPPAPHHQQQPAWRHRGSVVAAAASAAGPSPADDVPNSGTGSAPQKGPPAAPTPDSAAAAKAPSRAAELQDQLRRYGLAGLLAYGLLNSLYYSVMFLVVWVYVAKVPSGLGLAGAAQKFLQVFALTWGGSQVTKIARAAGALALAPLVDKLLDSLTERAGLASKRQAFGLVVGGCLAFALLLFAGVVVAYA